MGIFSKKDNSNFDDDTVQEQIEKNGAVAKEYLEDEDKMERFLERLERKLEKVPVIGDKLGDIPMLVSLVRAYVRKEYRDIPIGSMIAIVSALIYFVSPIDLIPDAIPIIGYADDAAVIAFALKLVADDVAEYKTWQRKTGRRIIDSEEE